MAKSQSPRSPLPVAKPHRKPAAPAPAEAVRRPPPGAPAEPPDDPALTAAPPGLLGRLWRQGAWICAVLVVIGFVAQDSLLRYRSLEAVTNAIIGLGRPVTEKVPAGLRLTGAASQRLGLKRDDTTPSGFYMDQHALVVPALGTDGYHWMMQTERERLSGDVRLRHSDYDNPPTGREVHWSGFLHWWTLGVAWLWTTQHPDVPLALAIAEVGPWANTLLLVILVLILAPLTARRFGWLPAALLSIGFVATYPLFEFFTTGYLDHHGLAAMCSLMMVLFLAAGGAGWLRSAGAPPEGLGAADRALWHWLPERQTARRWFIASGILGGAGLWISAASLVPAMFGIGVSVLVGTMLLGRGPGASPWRSDPTLWRVWGFAGAATSIFFYLLEYLPDGFGMRLEVNHPLYALAWAGAGDLLCRVSQWWHRAERPTAVATFPWLAAAVDLAVIAALPLMILLFKQEMFAITDKFLWALHEDYILEFRSLARQLSYLNPIQIAGGISMISLLVFGATVLLWRDDFPPLAGAGWRAFVLAALLPGLLALHSVMFPLVNGALDELEWVPVSAEDAKARIEQAKIAALNDPAQTAAMQRIIGDTQRLLGQSERRAHWVAFFADLIVLGLLFALPVWRGPPLLPRPWKAMLLLTLVPALVMLVLALRQVRWLGIGCALWLAVLVAMLTIAMRVRYLNSRLTLIMVTGVVVAAATGLGLLSFKATFVCVLLFGLVCGLGRLLGGYGRPALVLTAALPPMLAVLFTHVVNLFFTDFINSNISAAEDSSARLEAWESFLLYAPWALAAVAAVAGGVRLARLGLKREEWVQLGLMAGALWLFAGVSYLFGTEKDYSAFTVFAAGMGALLAIGQFTARPGLEPSASFVAGALLALVLLPYPCFTLYQWNAGGWRYPPGQLEVTQVITRDVSMRLRKRLGDEPGGIVSGPTTTTWMTYFGGFKGLGTLYWENIDGLKAVAAIYSARNVEDAYRLIQQHKISHIAVYSWDPFFLEYTRLHRDIRLKLDKPDEAPTDAFITRLLNNRLPSFPSWLRPLPYRMANIPGLEYAYVKLYEVVPPQAPEAVAVSHAQYYFELDQPAEAVKQLNAVLSAQPNYLPALSLMAYVQFKLGNQPQFQALVGRIIQLLPQAPQTMSLNDRMQLAMVLALARQNNLAREQMAAAVASAEEADVRRLPPYLLVNFHGLARQLGQGDLRPEIMALAWDLLPSENRADALTDRATIEAQSNAMADAVGHFKEALLEYPNHLNALSRLAWVYATHPDATYRNGAEAVRLAREAVQQNETGFRQADANLLRARQQNAPPAVTAQLTQAQLLAQVRLCESLDILAAAHAEAGQFTQAAGVADRAVRLAQAAGDPGKALEILNRAMQYQQGRPYHFQTAQPTGSDALNAPLAPAPAPGAPPPPSPGFSPFAPSPFSPVAPPLAPAPSPTPPAPGGPPINLR